MRRPEMPDDRSGGRSAHLTDGTRSLQRAIGILRLMARMEASGARLSDLARLAEIPHPSMHRILKCLIAERLVVQDPVTRLYQLGPLNFELGLATMHKTEFQQRFRPNLEQIAAQTGDTAYLIARSGLDFVCLDRVEGSYPIRAVMLHVGGRRPLFLGAGGQSLMASLKPAEFDRMLRALGREIALAGMEPESVRRGILRAREAGFGLVRDNAHLGVASLAISIPEPSGAPRFAVSLAMVSDRMTPAHQGLICTTIRTELAKFGDRLKG